MLYIQPNILPILLIYLQAKDPENEQVNYSIVSGNDLRQFSIGANTGIITVIRRLDREVLTRYQLVSLSIHGKFRIYTLVLPASRIRRKPEGLSG